MMKVRKIPIDDKVWAELERMAEDLGMKPNAYVQFILGQHVKVMEGKYKPDALTEE